MYHTIAFADAAAIVGSNPNHCAGIADSVLSQDVAGNFILPEPLYLIAAGYFDGSPKSAYLSSPKLNQVGPRYIRPIVGALTPPSRPAMQIEVATPFQFRALESLSAYVNTALSVAGHVYVAAMLAQGIEQIPQGDVWEVHGAVSTATTAATWSKVTYALDQALPDGVYAMIGSDVISTTGILHRWTFWGKNLRPGHLCSTAAGNTTWEPSRLGTFGLMGTFKNTNLPILEVLSDAAETPSDVYLRLIKVS